MESFLQNSPGLRKVVPRSGSATRQLRRLPEGDVPRDENDHCEYHYESRPAEWWWSGELREKGRIHEIPAEGAHHRGRVIYDEAAGIVYVNVTFS